MKKFFLKFTILIFALNSCTMAPKYVQPKAPVVFEQTTNKDAKKISQISWQEYFQSPDLKRVIQLALDNNRDLRKAVLNIEVAEGIYGISRSSLMPSISTQLSETRQAVPNAFTRFIPPRQYRSNVGFADYELDFFGRLRSLKNAAQESFLASKEAKNIVEITLISDVANAYAQYLLDFQLLQIAQNYANLQEERIKFVEKRYQNDIDSKETFLNAQAIAEAAKINFENYKKLLEQDKNALMNLVGVFDSSALPEVQELNKIQVDESILEFVASENLLERPDIKQAEHNLKSANADIGAARAAFFPSISLTATYGYSSNSMSTLWNKGSNSWSFTPQINLPIFSGGRNIASLDVAHARKKIEIANYEKTIQNAFREVSDQLAERKAIANQLNSYNKILDARRNSYQISDLKKQNGLISKLEAIDSEVNFLMAQQNQLTAQKQFFVNLIALYKVMGGGVENGRKL